MILPHAHSELISVSLMVQVLPDLSLWTDGNGCFTGVKAEGTEIQPYRDPEEKGSAIAVHYANLQLSYCVDKPIVRLPHSGVENSALVLPAWAGPCTFCGEDLVGESCKESKIVFINTAYLYCDI